MGRPRPLTIPVVTLIPTLRGLPMAMTGSPTPTEPESPSVSGSSSFPGASTRNTATSVEGSCPTSSASLRAPSANLTEMSSAPSTTCWLVTMCPASSTTNPEPPAGPASGVAATSTLTTPRPSRTYTSRTEEPPVVAVFPEDSWGATSFMVTLSDSSSRPYTPRKRKSAVIRPPMIADTSAVSAVLNCFALSILCHHADLELSVTTSQLSIFHRPSSCTRNQVPWLCWILWFSVAWVSPVTVAVSPEILASGPSTKSTLFTLSKVLSKASRFGKYSLRQPSARSSAGLSYSPSEVIV